MTSSLPRFTPATYRHLIESLLETGYRPVSFEDAAAAPGELLLRHDVDLSTEAAATIAAVEAEVGVTATYFVLPDSGLYNLHAPETRARLSTIVDLGHEIGLHVDMAAAGDDALAHVAHWRDVLTTAIGMPIRVASFHRPGAVMMGAPRASIGITHAYERRFVEDFFYISDSKRVWRFDDTQFVDACRKLRPLQVNTHPVWWCFSGPDDTVGSTIDALLGRLMSDARRDVMQNIIPYCDAIERDLDVARSRL